MRRWLKCTLPALVAGLSVGLALLDHWVGGEAFQAGDFIFDVFERAVLFAAVSAVAWLTIDFRELRSEQAALREDLARAIDLGEAWRTGNAAALDDLAAAIQEQFDTWR